MTIAVCLAARVAWMFLSYFVWLKFSYGLPVPEAAASHWFTWALGAIGVELYFGLIQLPRWSRDLRLSGLLITGATVLSYYLQFIPKDTFAKDFAWYRLVLAEQSWIRRATVPSAVSLFATLGIFSYSLYLTHELVVIVSWLQSVNVLLLTVPVTILFAWVFFWLCERPFMVRGKSKSTESAGGHARPAWTASPQSQPSTVSD